VTCEKHVSSSHDDGEEGEQFSVGEGVLDPSCPLDVPAVDERQDHDAADGEHAHALVGRVALGEERLEYVDAESEGDDGEGARPHDHALDPQTHERQERAERLHDVGVVRAGLGDHAAQLGVAVRPHHGEESRDGPDYERDVDRARVLEDSSGTDEYARPDDAAHDHGDAVGQRHLRLEAHAIILLALARDPLERNLLWGLELLGGRAARVHHPYCCYSLVVTGTSASHEREDGCR